MSYLFVARSVSPYFGVSILVTTNLVLRQASNSGENSKRNDCEETGAEKRAAQRTEDIAGFFLATISSRACFSVSDP